MFPYITNTLKICRYLAPRREQAENILNLCNAALLKTSFVQNLNPGLEMVMARIQDFVKNLDELQHLIQHVLRDSEKVYLPNKLFLFLCSVFWDSSKAQSLDRTLIIILLINYYCILL